MYVFLLRDTVRVLGLVEEVWDVHALYMAFLIQLLMWKNEIVQKIQGKGSARTELIFT